MRVSQNARLILTAVLLGLGYVAVGATQLDRYGATWDFGKIFYGERYLACYLDASLRHLDFRQPTIVWPPGHPDLDTMVTEGPDTCWPLGAITSAATHRLFGCTGLLPPLASYYAAPLLWAGLLIGVLTFWIGARFGLTAGALAGLLLALHPVFLGHAWMNFQDVPASATFAFALIAGVAFIERRTWRSAVLAGVMFGLALAAKTNSVFVLPILALYFLTFPTPGSPLPKKTEWLAFLGRGLVAYVAIAPLCLFLLWPWLWQDGLHHLRLHLSRLPQDSMSDQPGGKGVIAAFFSTPPLAIVAAAIALFGGPLAWRGPRLRALALLVLWCAVPIVRASLPHLKSYDGIRRYLEFVPALAGLAAIGCAVVRDLISRTKLAPVALAVAAVPVVASAVAVAASMPWTIAYQSVLARMRAEPVPGANDFWATSYRAGLQWIGEHEHGPADVFVGKGQHVAQHDLKMFGPPGLRLFGPWCESASLPSQSYYVMYVTRPEFQTPMFDLLEQRAQPIHTIAIGDRPLLLVFHVAAGSALHDEIREIARKEDQLLATRLELFERKAEEDPNNRFFLESYAAALARSAPPAEVRRKLEHFRPRILDPTVRANFEAYLKQLDDPKVFLGEGR
jgi:hypothetical protein